MRKELPKIITIFFITVGVIVWGLNFVFFGAPKSKATGETVIFVFDPASVSQASGDFTTHIKVKPSIVMTIRGYQFNINFDKSKVQFKSITYITGAVSTGVGDDNSKITTINQNGVVKVIGEIQTATGLPITADQNTELVTVTFTAVSALSSSITTGATDAGLLMIKSDFSLFTVPSAGQASFSINGVVPTLTSAPTITSGGPTLTPTPTGAAGNVNLKLKLKFQGIVSKPADARNKLSVKIKLYNETTNLETAYNTADFTADDQGIWSGSTSFNVDISAKYIIYAKGPYHIQKKICDAAPTETAGGTYRCTKGNITLVAGDNNLNLSGVVLLSGDLPDQDGSITAYDTSFVYNNLGKTDNDKCDVNRDGICNTQDYSLVIASLSVKNDEL